jgi:hypothetical protein
MTYLSADELVALHADTNTSWESRLDYEMAQELIGRELSKSEWAQLIDELDDLVFETVMSYQLSGEKDEFGTGRIFSLS